MIKVVFDSNVYISGIFFKGNARKAIEYALEGKISLYTSQEIIQEIKNVLQSKKFNLENDAVEYITNEIENISQIIFPKQKIKNICRDNDDHIILECALESSSEYIVTGDKDLLVLKEYKKTRIITIKEFIALL